MTVPAPSCQTRADIFNQVLIVPHEQDRPLEHPKRDVERVDLGHSHPAFRHSKAIKYVRESIDRRFEQPPALFPIAS